MKPYALIAALAASLLAPAAAADPSRQVTNWAVEIARTLDACQSVLPPATHQVYRDAAIRAAEPGWGIGGLTDDLFSTIDQIVGGTVPLNSDRDDCIGDLEYQLKRLQEVAGAAQAAARVSP